MNRRTRLDTISPRLAAEIFDASPDRQRRIVFVACEFAAKRARLIQPEVVSALEILREGGIAPPEMKISVEELASRADDAYLDSLERQDAPEDAQRKTLELFAQARALSAIALALDPTTAMAPHDVIYEAAMATDLREELLEKVAKIARGTS